MMVQMGKTVTTSRDVGVEDLQLLGDGDTYELYWDDGITRHCTEENIRVLEK